MLTAPMRTFIDVLGYREPIFVCVCENAHKEVAFDRYESTLRCEDTQKKLKAVESVLASAEELLQQVSPPSTGAKQPL